MFLYVYIYICTHPYITYIHTYTHIQPHTCICIYIYIHIYIHTYIHVSVWVHLTTILIILDIYMNQKYCCDQPSVGWRTPGVGGHLGVGIGSFGASTQAASYCWGTLLGGGSLFPRQRRVPRYLDQICIYIYIYPHTHI